jgi:hypothetical protein
LEAQSDQILLWFSQPLLRLPLHAPMMGAHRDAEAALQKQRTNIMLTFNSKYKRNSSFNVKFVRETIQNKVRKYCTYQVFNEYK